MKPAICFEMLYPDLEPAQKIQKIAEFGFHYVEFWGWRDKDIPGLISTCSEYGVNIVNFSGHRKGSLVAADTHDLFLADLKEAVSVADRLECSILMLLSNELGEGGVVEKTYPNIPQNTKCNNMLMGLEKALAVIPDHFTLVLEPLNTKVDHSGYYLADMKTAVSLIRTINDPRCKILCDLYHFGVMGDNLNAIISEDLDHIGHIHVADFPGRHEPGTGSADWPALLTVLKEEGYTEYVGFEYSPLNDSGESLNAIRSLWDKVIS